MMRWSSMRGEEDLGRGRCGGKSIVLNLSKLDYFLNIKICRKT